MTTSFDDLPVELLHMIFEYLSYHDIIYSFINLNSYLNSILNTSKSRQLNLQLISKRIFDFLCQSLLPEYIQFLTLSNDIHTPKQIQLFFQSFSLKKFHFLQSLTLLSIINEDIHLIQFDLPKLPYLHSLFTQSRLSQPLFIGQLLIQLKTLENLSISFGDIFDHNISCPLYNLKCLDVGLCTFLELRRLQMIVPRLISLKIILQAEHQLQLLIDSKIWNNLERLDLTLNDSTVIVTFNEIQQFLQYFSSLKSLTLNLRGLSTDLSNGFQWENCSTICHLRKFSFLIEFTDQPVENLLEIFDTFSISFWIQLKKWYVTINSNSISTINCFLDVQSIDLPLTTAPDYRWFYRKIKQIQIEKTYSTIDLIDFSHVEIFECIDDSFVLSNLNFKHFPYLYHLIFHQSISSIILHDIIQFNSQITYLTFKQNDFKHFHYSYSTITHLSIDYSIRFLKRLQMKYLCRIFPSIKYLSIHLNSIRSSLYFIENFLQLENAIFYFDRLNQMITSEWIRENTHLTNQFTCSCEDNRFSIWISSISRLNHEPSLSTEKCSLQ